MKYKYLVFTCIILILSISAVSAADNATEDIIMDDNTQDLSDLQTLIDEDMGNNPTLTDEYMGNDNNQTSASPFEEAYDFIKEYNTTPKFEVKLADVGAGETVSFYINGVYYNRTTDSNGVAALNINLIPGQYKIASTYNNYVKYNTVTVLESGNHVGCNTVKQVPEQINLNTTINAYNLYKVCIYDDQFSATIFDFDGKLLANTTVTFYVNGVYYNRTTDSNGQAKLNINLPPGQYSITSINTVTGQRTYNLITVVSPFAEANDLVKKYNTETQFKVKLINWGAGETVTFYINGVYYNRTTDQYCVAALNINLMPGQYVIASTHNKYTTYNTVTVVNDNDDMNTKAASWSLPLDSLPV